MINTFVMLFIINENVDKIKNIKNIYGKKET